MKKISSVVLTILILACVAKAQTSEPPKFSVHEDVVKPSMDAKYREAMKKLKAACELNKTAFGWSTFGFDDGSYNFLSSINSLADLDTNPFADLETKMGKETFGKVWAEFDDCLVTHRDYAVVFLSELSYLSPPSGENFRELLYLHVLPGKSAEAEALMAEWKKLYESKKSLDGFLVFKTIIGHDDGEYLVISWGKDREALDAKAKKANELMGAEAGILWAKTLLVLQSYDLKGAYVLPEFSYHQAK